MFEFAVIDSLGAEPDLLYCNLGFKIPTNPGLLPRFSEFMAFSISPKDMSLSNSSSFGVVLSLKSKVRFVFDLIDKFLKCSAN